MIIYYNINVFTQDERRNQYKALNELLNKSKIELTEKCEVLYSKENIQVICENQELKKKVDDLIKQNIKKIFSH
jgi:hypothetical protein